MRATTNGGQPWPPGLHGYYVTPVTDTNLHDVACAGCDWTQRTHGSTAAHDAGRRHVAESTDSKTPSRV